MSASASCRALIQALRRHRLRVWALWLVGAVVILSSPLGLLDPAAVMFLLDPELLAISVGVGAALVWSNTLVVQTRAQAAAAAVRGRWQAFGRRTWASLLVRAW